MSISMSRIRGRMRRRLLLTYRVDPTVARSVIPAPFRPQIVDGSAVGGVCLIALTELRPGWILPRIGVSAENAAHRFAVEWDEGEETRTGVYVMERHTSGVVPVIGGGRFFPGVQQRARFDVEESGSRFQVRMDAPGAHVEADIELTDEWESTLFSTIAEASQFYRAGAIGWSPRRDDRGAEALELTSTRWEVEAGRVREVSSSFFDRLPSGSAEIDSVLVMRDIPVIWQTPDMTRP
jgi:hypothetical protein